ncbi:4-aminobutyrate aminotransferase-like enzyme [Agrobacterium tumefaciens]|uniref:4-aminobutyrate aminotransferase-like enzyme n=1 Tax=Agrobacterium radiobacter TaxID=362 RepID=A0ABR6JCM9_AGRRD|nr:aspartate aminotransferase family protein [Agrobacterium radiobacter]MBB4320461.1 4-aminobutyrate aminotransferase-like enzyme [Agrobacterium radiobacter]MBB4337126.1 4-aminobutyrate aminotransferase-like enzyme [Agrobacterium radiobacter]MBB4492626.1 4-aminobutyrate aminotransferase-like enzyme [Agrobacterium radiobacter]MBB4497524.1 4-aminobutyrate aminotransferase-like enzyme [Agrobacterium radiobacter]MBB4502565.1 4-aminobutyrate aminotransferase-like enzyme [Agrobacterium radiobacter]
MSDQATRLPKGFRGDMPNGFNPQDTSHLTSEERTHIARRQRLLGPAYRLFYRTPVEISRGKGVYLYDKQGVEYLDAYNNVVSLGHSHPRVVEAIQKQLELLCTHTRYMQEPLLDYAEVLLGTFGGELGKTGCAMFTCTGSEANDLALRIARYHTRKTGVIVTAEAYHGNSGSVAAISPSLGKKSPLDPFLRTVPAPDSYRIPVAEIGRRMAEDVSRQIADLERHGGGLAAFIADSVFSSDGLYVNPTDVLAPVADVVRKAGGLFIADEVQSGFGRTGTHLWGHQRHKVDPDIVTMGKPMGNGYPVAGVVLRSELVSEFGSGMRYFNTFGGNSVAIAAASAVLETIRDEGLLDNAAKIGSEILDGLQDLQTKYEFVGDVRGAGLYFAVELVKDREEKTPDMDRALAAINALRDQRILISATGADAHILKIRPPLIFTSSNAARLLEGIDVALRSVQT